MSRKLVKAQVCWWQRKVGGIKICHDEEVIKTVDKMIGMKLVTPQTNEAKNS